ncbi:uncharacterized protein LOC134656539 [Cydia amplana]|uniref:uncharacterized protein LOC134656539 n=1 Tax=Cydia amplana TaxID=1869771 RepID=UPI002FE57BA9
MPPHGDEVIDNVTPPVANTLGASTTATSTSTLMLGGAGVMEKLEGAGNFLSWKFTMKMMLTLEGLWDLIVRLDDTPLTGSDVVRDQRALARLCLGLKPGLYQYVRDAKSAKDAWKKLSDVFEDRGLYRRVLLLRQLHRIEFSHFSSMSSYIEKVMSLVHQLSDIEKTVEDEEIAEILLSGLPPEYDSLVSNLETLCLTSKLSSEVVRTRLLQEEQRKDSMNASSTSTTSAFVSKKQITCKYCGKPGHVKAKCFKLRREKMAKKRDNKDQHASAYLAHAAAAELFLDSGSSNHLVKDKELLCNLKDTSAQSISTANKQQMTSTSAGELNLVMNNKGDAYDKCEACLKGKMATKPFPKASSSRTTQPLQLIHSDVCGPLPEASWGGARYLVTFTDDFTRKTFGYLMKNKSQVMSYFIQFKALVEKQLNLPIKCLRSDNGKEYCNLNFTEYLQKHGIIHQTTVPYSSSQNGTAERAFRTLFEKARCMLQHASLEKRFWGEAIMAAIYLKNRSPTTALSGRIPEEVWSGSKVDLSHLRVFGCMAYSLVPKNKRDKLDAKGKEYIFVGYSETSKGYRLADPLCPTKVIISRNVAFIENKFRGSYPQPSEADSEEQINIFNFDCDTTKQNCDKNINEFNPNNNELNFNNDQLCVSDSESNDINGDNISISDGVYCTGSEDESEPAGLSASEDELDPAGLPAREPSSEPLTSPCETTARDGAATGPATVASHTGRPIRSTRNVQPPRFSDYDMTDNSFMVFENPFISEPLTYNEAVNSAHSKEWLEAMTREYDALVANNVWELVDRPVDKNIVKCKWVYKVKYDASVTLPVGNRINWTRWLCHRFGGEETASSLQAASVTKKQQALLFLWLPS